MSAISRSCCTSLSWASNGKPMTNVRLSAQATPAQPALADFPEPESLNGTNLSYALQWWFFAAAIPVGAVLLARREKEESAGVVRQRHRGRAEEEEDALIEAQLAATRE